MKQKVVVSGPLEDDAQISRDVEYWQSRPPEERVAAVDYLRRQYYGDTARLQRVVRVVERS